MIINLGTPSFELQINFGVLQIDTENSATGMQASRNEWKLRILGEELKKKKLGKL